MTTPRGKAPQTKTNPNGRKAGASRSKASSTRKIAEPGTKQRQDLADTAAQPAGGAQAAPAASTSRRLQWANPWILRESPNARYSGINLRTDTGNPRPASKARIVVYAIK